MRIKAARCHSFLSSPPEMGLDGLIKKNVFEHWAAAAVKGSKTVAVRGRPRDIHTDIVDYLTKFRCIPDGDVYTLPLLADNLVQQITGQTTILACDYRPKVPKMKADTHADRAASSAKALAKRGLEEASPYPANAQWDFESGWVKWSEPESGPNDEIVDAPKLEPISLPRLAKSRWYGAADDPHRHSNLGNELWQTMHARLQRVVSLSNSVRQVFFDHKADGPVLFGKDTTGEGKLLESMKHNLGEADTAMTWWAKQYDGKVDHIHIRTCDGDQMAIYALYHGLRDSECVARTKIWWHCDSATAVDLAEMIRLMLGRDFVLTNGHTRRFPSARHIGVFFILCGTDFFSQRVVAYGNGVDKMLMAFLMIDWEAIALKFTEADWAAPALDQPSPLLDHLMREWMVRMYHYKLPGGKLQVPEAHRKKSPPQAPVSMERIRCRMREKEDAAKDAMAHKQQQAREELVAKHEKQQEYLQTKDQIMELRCENEAQREAALLDLVQSDERVRKEEAAKHRKEMRELKAKQQSARESMWFFPDEPEVHWAAQVLTWNYAYWRAASLGVHTPEPVRPQSSLKHVKRCSGSSACAASSSSSSFSVAAAAN
jgi:hypothetical protein